MESAVVYYCKFLLEIEGSQEINVEKNNNYSLFFRNDRIMLLYGFHFVLGTLFFPNEYKSCL